MEKLRKVLYKPDDSDEFSEIGYFHQLFNDSDGIKAIIETLEGMLETINISDIKFIKPPDTRKKVLYKKYNYTNDDVSGSESDEEDNDEYKIGIFLAWGKSTDMIGSDIVDLIDVAIIQEEDGNVRRIEIGNFKFIE